MDNIKEIIIQGLSIVGFTVMVLSFQCKKTRNLFIMQSVAGLIFALHFYLMGQIGGALYNFVMLIRGVLYLNNDRKLWKLIAVEGLYTAAFAFSVYSNRGDPFGIFLVTLPYLGLLIMSYVMWTTNEKWLRLGQLFAGSPTWIVHNIFNFSLGGLMCEIFNMISVAIALVRFRKK